MAAALVPVWLAACSSQSAIERQREDNVAAAERESVPPPFASLRRTGELTRDDRAAWRKRLQWPDACEQAFQATSAGSTAGLTFHTAGSGITLVEIRCASTGLQPTQLFIRLDERGSSPLTTVLEFPRVPAPATGPNGPAAPPHDRQVTSQELTGEVVVAPDGHTISVLTVARTTRDCGTWVRYAVGGEHPRIAAATSHLPCPAEVGTPAMMAGNDGPAGWSPIASGH